MRLFVAARLPIDLLARLEALQRELKDAPLPVRWVRAEGIHLTLKFLGEVVDSRLGEIERTIADAGGSIAPFRLEAVGAVPFPGRGVPRIIWVELRGDVGRAAALATALDAAAARIGFPRETREFRPHLTLGRVRGKGGTGWREAFDRASGRGLGAFDVAEYVLFESRLEPLGAVYTALEAFPLGGTVAAGGAA